MVLESLAGKKILFLCPSFFGYENEIKNELTAQGADVDYFDERPLNSTIGKILIRIGVVSLIKKQVDKYYRRIIKRAGVVKYDYIFVVSPESITSNILKEIKLTNVDMISIVYMWDSVKNKRNSVNLLDFFDVCYSFDRNESFLFEKMQFLPLFFSANFDVDFVPQSINKYSLIFIGTIHSDRFNLVNQIKCQFKDRDLPPYIFFYCPSKFLFFIKKIFNKEFNDVSINDVSFLSLDKKSVRQLICESDVVIDIEHPSQTGLTMRTIEILGLNKKLITTNIDIKNYDFYSNDNIFVVDRKNPIVSESFINNKFVPPSREIVKKYSLTQWVKVIFMLNH